MLNFFGEFLCLCWLESQLNIIYVFHMAPYAGKTNNDKDHLPYAVENYNLMNNKKFFSSNSFRSQIIFNLNGRILYVVYLNKKCVEKKDKKLFAY